MFRFATALILVCCVACAEEAADDARGGIGKADVTGTCAGTTCDGPGRDGNCYCDAGCAMYGDCCADRPMICEAGPGPGGGAPDVPELGASPTFTTIATAADGLSRPRDLAFHPTRNELWTLNQGTEGVVVVFAPGGASQRETSHVDVMHDHFMSAPSALAFGASNTFASCQESVNHGNHFMGPTLWSASLSVFAAVNQEATSRLLGSHLDMLHQSPLCMGIAHDHGNAYWAFDGQNGHIVYYDFATDHGPGYDDHADGIVRRYPEALVRRRAGVPGHLVLDEASGWLYVADTGRNRVIRLDTSSGEPTTLPPPGNEPLAEYTAYTRTMEEVFATGVASPSGIVIANGRLFVGSFDSGEIVAFDLATRAELGRVATGASGPMGLAWGAGKLWFADGLGDTVKRVDP